MQKRLIKTGLVFIGYQQDLIPVRCKLLSKLFISKKKPKVFYLRLGWYVFVQSLLSVYCFCFKKFQEVFVCR